MHQLLHAVMQDTEIRKDLRKQKNWTQKELGNRIGLSFTQLNKYEGGTNIPPLDKLIALASALETSIDYLVTGELTEHAPLPNVRLMERFKELTTFDPDDQEMVIKLIDAVIVKHHVEHAMRVGGSTKKAS
jgi:transcriptional regulator with XRE-family HTH domain